MFQNMQNLICKFYTYIYGCSHKYIYYVYTEYEFFYITPEKCIEHVEDEWKKLPEFRMRSIEIAQSILSKKEREGLKMHIEQILLVTRLFRNSKLI